MLKDLKQGLEEYFQTIWASDIWIEKAEEALAFWKVEEDNQGLLDLVIAWQGLCRLSSSHSVAVDSLKEILQMFAITNKEQVVLAQEGFAFDQFRKEFLEYKERLSTVKDMFGFDTAEQAIRLFAAVDELDLYLAALKALGEEEVAEELYRLTEDILAYPANFSYVFDPASRYILAQLASFDDSIEDNLDLMETVYKFVPLKTMAQGALLEDALIGLATF